MSEPRYRRAPATLWRRVGDEVLLATPEGDDVDRLSAPAAAAWLLLEPPRTRDELTRAMAEELGAGKPEIEERIEDLLGQLAGRGWVVPATDDA